jgi:hypothetical protein
MPWVNWTDYRYTLVKVEQKQYYYVNQANASVDYNNGAEGSVVSVCRDFVKLPLILILD